MYNRDYNCFLPESTTSSVDTRQVEWNMFDPDRSLEHLRAVNATLTEQRQRLQEAFPGFAAARTLRHTRNFAF